MSSKKLVWRSLILVVIIGIAIWVRNQKPSPRQINNVPSSNASSAVLGARTKTGGCSVIGALPDSSCTPGTIITTASKDQICIKGYSKSVRKVNADTKRQVFEAYNIAAHESGEYEVDHLISLELGGSNDIANLWPEAADPPPGFHEKDIVENNLHNQVCSGAISLSDAQQKISTNWLQLYQLGQ